MEAEAREAGGRHPRIHTYTLRPWSVEYSSGTSVVAGVRWPMRTPSMSTKSCPSFGRILSVNSSGVRFESSLARNVLLPAFVIPKLMIACSLGLHLSLNFLSKS